MNADELRHVIEAHRRFPAVIEGLVAGIPTARLRARPADAKWSPLEILVHLRDEEVEDFRARTRAAAEGRAITAGIDPEGWVVKRAYNEQDPAATLADFDRERAASCDWLATLDPAVLANEVDVMGRFRQRCGDFLASWRTHDLLHLRQLATTLARNGAAAELGGWRVEYAGDLSALG